MEWGLFLNTVVSDTFPHPKADLDIKQAANHTAVERVTTLEKTASFRLYRSESFPSTSFLQSETESHLLAKLRGNILILLSTSWNRLHLPVLLCNSYDLPPQIKDLSTSLVGWQVSNQRCIIFHSDIQRNFLLSSHTGFLLHPGNGWERQQTNFVKFHQTYIGWSPKTRETNLNNCFSLRKENILCFSTTRVLSQLEC